MKKTIPSKTVSQNDELSAAYEILDGLFALPAENSQIISELRNVLRFKSEKSSPAPDAPFGKEIKACLDYVLRLARSFGLETYDCDGYAGHADWKGTGGETLGILGHLDVVPASQSDGWICDPYGASLRDVDSQMRLYARGAMDDKGPMIACLFAVKALKDAGCTLSKTVRLIFGCDEESGMECVEHYFSKMPKPTVSFSPDGDFPVINREKGIYQFDVICGKLPDGTRIEAGDRANVVPARCTVFSRRELKGLRCERTKEGYFCTTVGKAAHGSTPDEGINAAHEVIRALAETYPDDKTAAFLLKTTDSTGGKWGIALSDKESGKLTCNLGVLKTSADGTITATVDIRFPVTYNCKQMYELLRANTPEEFEIAERHTSEPLFVPSDSALVTTLMDVYNSRMGTDMQPLAIGGGTYSRCLPNCVAFGPLFPHEEQTIHMPNECIDLSNLRTMTQLYMEAIYRLAK